MTITNPNLSPSNTIAASGSAAPSPIASRKGFVTLDGEHVGWWRKKGARFESCRVGHGAYDGTSYRTKREAIQAVVL